MALNSMRFEPCLGVFIASISGLAHPGSGCPKVRRETPAMLVEFTDMILRASRCAGDILLRRFREPGHRRRVVLRHAQTLHEELADVVLRGGVPLIGGFAKP